MEIMSSPGLKALGWSFEDATGKMIEVSRFARARAAVTVFFVLITQVPRFRSKFIQKVSPKGRPTGLHSDTSHCLPQSIYHFFRRLRTGPTSAGDPFPQRYSLARRRPRRVMPERSRSCLCQRLGEAPETLPWRRWPWIFPHAGIDTG